MRGNGFTVSAGRLRANSLGGFSFVVLSHNTILGAAGMAWRDGMLAVMSGRRRIDFERRTGD
jgi:aspartate-semialdehyde dehydrogenase